MFETDTTIPSPFVRDDTLTFDPVTLKLIKLQLIRTSFLLDMSAFVLPFILLDATTQLATC